MDQIRSLHQMVEEAKKLCAAKGKKRVSVAMAEDAGLISAIEDVRKAGLIEATLVGNADKVKACIAQAGASESDYTIIDEKSEARCGTVAVTEVSSKRADIYMKGQLHTDHFLRGMLNKEVGLRTGKPLSHVAVFEIEGIEQLLFLADVAFMTYPTLEDKVNIINNTVEVCHACGIANPKVAALTAVEVVNPKMPETIEAAELSKMQDDGLITGCIVDGPLSFDLAIDHEAAKHKNATDRKIIGDADVLLFPDIHSGNT